MLNDVPYGEYICSAIRSAIDNGLSYSTLIAEIETIHGSDLGWNTNSLRQFAFRNAAEPKLSPKVLALCGAILSLSDRTPSLRSALDDRQMSYLMDICPKPARQTFEDGGMEGATVDFSKHVSTAHQSLRKKSSYLPFRSMYIFARFSSPSPHDQSSSHQHKKINLSLTYMQKSPSGFSFMQKSMEGNRKKIVTGDVSHTQLSLTFSGISYFVTSPISDKNFLKMNPFDLTEIKRHTSSIEGSIDRFLISHQDLHHPVMPAIFSCIDRYGRPTTGVGIMISETEFSTFKLGERGEKTFDYQNETKKPDYCEIRILLESLDAVTIPISPVASDNLGDCVMEIKRKGMEKES